MKKLSLLLLLCIANLTIAQDFQNADQYLDYIGKEQELISKSTWKYTTAVAHSKSARKIDNTRKTLLKSIQTSSNKIAALKNGYKGDTEFRDQVLSYLSFSEKSINEEYDKIINMQEVAEQSYDYMEAYIMMRDLVNKKIDEEVEKFNTNQKVFANKNGIQISENTSEISKKMKISNDVFDAHTELYLIFFKTNITDINLSKSIENKDINSIQQNLSSLELYANEGLGKLKTIKGYENDNSLINATKKALEFYKKEALEYGPSVISFIMLNQKFDDNKKVIENKSEKNRTKEEVDNFNKLVNELNKEVGNYNKINNKYFNEKNTILNEWNTIGENFISKHVPKD